VRYIKVERQGAEGEERVTHWIATLQYTYTAPSQDPVVRRWNPLGFRILELVSEPEVLVGASPAENR
jgi:type IV secretion system protein VirB8